ncbi:uncharacterized protein LOC119683672 [Teleopsis dalmanni]|uniref:uncharacterized protein LOC119683672 n=1 Tax=Teleopsis dalmanni TaxID=139649 RepID=UPI0018CD0679|nr:uncharacterized protein LOC119683672 [Teleopsis dalmanni]
MKYIPIHTQNTVITYKNALCSAATFIVLILIILSVMIPVLLVSILSPYSSIAESRVLYEQPKVRFQFQYFFLAELAEVEVEESNSTDNTTERWMICSTMPRLNAHLQHFTHQCEGVQFWTKDFENDGVTDRAHFQLQLMTEPTFIKKFDLLLFFEAKLTHKCDLLPPALLMQSLTVPIGDTPLYNGLILLKTELKHKQYIEYSCPFPGRNLKTEFHDVLPNGNTSSNLKEFAIESILDELKINPGFFQLSLEETYVRPEPNPHLRIQVDIKISQVPVRYHLSIWERLGQFWLYFASFFGISFYVLNKIKDYLFSHQIIRSWEIIPWKKLY